jgi:hypothetical protein
MGEEGISKTRKNHNKEYIYSHVDKKIFGKHDIDFRSG